MKLKSFSTVLKPVPVKSMQYYIFAISLKAEDFLLIVCDPKRDFDWNLPFAVKSKLLIKKKQKDEIVTIFIQILSFDF